ncbi:uncharacterized protein F5891DRAFT_1048648 [Suillus fuscotomentosus]|uniref:Uncharacterized protein n=1 Tax=Suillus fuscotomentosus TaxID=1912939 RepID=A0AAD4E0I0_9AGAM|nr:uncharacterized protein F5891DRAFT_1048648 [Suillus fuscotomentosus]KAG1897474.1 hypothetical protein F5891DRAFT_1048648 [Suillus fuscotomentosus]
MGTGPSTRITRRQLPVTPAYAFTDFKAQGQTIDHVLVDINWKNDISHGRECIRLLRDFDNDLFLQHPNEDLQIEDNRIERLAEETKKCFSRTDSLTENKVP